MNGFHILKWPPLTEADLVAIVKPDFASRKTSEIREIIDRSARVVKEPSFVPATPAMPASPPPAWLTFHLAHPGPDEAMPGDPNCALFRNGRCHLHYIYKNRDGFSFAYVSS